VHEECHFFAFSPISTRRRIATGLEGLGFGCSLIHASTDASSDGGSRNPIWGAPLPSLPSYSAGPAFFFARTFRPSRRRAFLLVQFDQEPDEGRSNADEVDRKFDRGLVYFWLSGFVTIELAGVNPVFE
jgi:hypothetical protein